MAASYELTLVFVIVRNINDSSTERFAVTTNAQRGCSPFSHLSHPNPNPNSYPNPNLTLTLILTLTNPNLNSNLTLTLTLTLRRVTKVRKWTRAAQRHFTTFPEGASAPYCPCLRAPMGDTSVIIADKTQIPLYLAYCAQVRGANCKLPLVPFWSC